MDRAILIPFVYGNCHGTEASALFRGGRRGAALHQGGETARNQAAAVEPADTSARTGGGDASAASADARGRAYRGRSITARRGAGNLGAGGTDESQHSKPGSRRNG